MSQYGLGDYTLSSASYQLIEAAGQPFYEGLARLTKASLEGIQAKLGLDVVYPRFYR